MLELAYLTIWSIVSAHPELGRLCGGGLVVWAVERGLCLAVHTDSSLAALYLPESDFTSVLIMSFDAFICPVLSPDEGVVFLPAGLWCRVREASESGGIERGVLSEFHDDGI